MICMSTVAPAELIFVMAGRMERKPYGLELYRAGVAPRLVLSVGRFEVSKMGQLDLDCLGALVNLRDNTRPDERHFLVTLDALGIHVENARSPRWSTYGEALALRRYLETHPARSVLVISTDIHLRRVALAFEHVFRNASLEFRYYPVPHSENCWFVIKERLKLVGYTIILSMPEWAVWRLMRLRKGDRRY